MNNKNKLRVFIVLVVLLVVNTVYVVSSDRDEYMLQTNEGCCTVHVKHVDGVYTIKYNDNITSNTQIVIEHDEPDAQWVIDEMTQDWCNHHAK